MESELFKLKAINARLAAALKDAIPYVEGAYECAFPDQWENEEILQECKDAVALVENC